MPSETQPPFIGPDDDPPIDLNRDIMNTYRPLLEQYYYDETRFDTYLEQLGIVYPTLTPPGRVIGEGQSGAGSAPAGNRQES